MSDSYFVIEVEETKLVSTGNIVYSVENSNGGGIEATFNSLLDAEKYIESLGGVLEGVV